MTTEECENAILTHLAASEDTEIADTYTWASSCNLEPQTVIGAVKSLLVDQYIEATPLSTSYYVLSEEATGILKDGSQEMAVLKAVFSAENSSMTLAELQGAVGKNVAKIGMANAMKNGWIKKDGANLVAAADPATTPDAVVDPLNALQEAKGAEDAIDATVRVWTCSFYPAQQNNLYLVPYADCKELEEEKAHQTRNA